MLSLFNFSSSRAAPSAGFTMIEMMVVLAIFTIMTGVVMANLPQFRDQTALQLVAEEVSLVFRQAQAYGGGTRTFKTAGFPSYGIHTDLYSGAANNKRLTLFADSNANNQYDPDTGCGGVNSECLEVFDLTGPVIINDIKFCADATSDCATISGFYNGINIIFKRPEPGAKFYNLSGGTPISWSCVKIRLQSLRDTTKTKEIVVWSTGHIYVQNVLGVSPPGTCNS